MSHFPFKMALNTSTLFPFNLGVQEQIRIAAEAGYEGVELWVKDIEAYLAEGGTLAQLRQYIRDTGVEVVNGIAFFRWSDADEGERQLGLVQAANEMNMLAEIGCKYVAAPPSGNVASVTLDRMASNFAELAEIGRRIGIESIVEFWGRSTTLSRLSEAVYVAMQSGVPEAKILCDLFHMYTGGSELEGLSLVDGRSIGVVHVNDYPADPARDVIADKDRVFPGDGIGPTRRFAELLGQAGYNGYLSLELFIESFGEKSALEVAVHGLDKVKKAYGS